MPVASIERTAYPRFKRTISSRELHDAFTSTADETEWAQERTTTDQHKLALVVLLKCYQRLGYFPSLDMVPADVVAYVRARLGLAESVAAEHDAQRTAKWHRSLVRARLGVTYDPVKVRKRLALVICLVHTARVSARDDAVEMFCKRMAALHKRARDRLDQLREQHRVESERLLGVFGDVLTVVRDALAPSEGEEQGATDPIGEVSERAGRQVIKTLAEAGGVAALSGAHEAVSAHHGNNHAPLVAAFCRSHRSALFDLLDAVDLQSTSTDHTVADAVAFLKANRHRTGELIPEHRDGVPVDLSFAGEMWQKILRDKARPGRLVRRHFEVCVFSYLAAELRSGDIAVAGSDSYANLHAQLMPWSTCEPLVADYSAQAGIPASAGEFAAWLKTELTQVAVAVDAGYPANTDLVIDETTRVPVLKTRRGRERRASARGLEETIHERLPERALLDILTRTAYLLGWHRHFGPASGSDPKLTDPLARYVLMTFTYGTNLGPAQVARHLRGEVSAHELSTAGNKHVTAHKLHLASTDVINAHAQLDVARMWGDGSTAAADGSQVDTWENNLLAETSIRYGGYGGIAYRHIADTYIALFSRFIPCGVWEAVYIIDGLLRNESEVTPDVVHADTQGQSLPVFGLATLLGFELLPRIRNWKDLVFYRPDTAARYQHIDALFADQTIDWKLIEQHWPDLMRTVISIREGALSSVTLLRRLGNDSRKNRLYRAFREVGRAVRTLVLLRYLSESELREGITAMTNKVEAFHGFAQWLLFGGDLLGHNDPDYHEKIVKCNELIANCVIYQTSLDITDVVNQLVAEGRQVDPDDLATISPYITETVRRFGEWVLDTTPPDPTVTTRLDVAVAS